MKYTRNQFTKEYYGLWELGLLLPNPNPSRLFSVKYKKNEFDEYSRVTLKAMSVNDALERACYAITYSSKWRPEDIDLHAVYDEEENLLWVDEPFYNTIQKENEFRGMERRDFLALFGATSAAILFGFKPVRAMAGTTTTGLSGTASGFAAIGEQLYTTAGSYSWTVPAGVTSVSVVCVGGGAGAYGSLGGAGGELRYSNSISVTSGQNISVTVGAGGNHVWSGDDDWGKPTLFGPTITAKGGGQTGNQNNTRVAGSGGTGFLGGQGGSGGPSGGGGAGGYSGSGGIGGSNSTTAAAGSGGGGGGGGKGYYDGSSNQMSGGGGGVGIFGEGTSGAAGVNYPGSITGGSGGSGGAAGGNGRVACGEDAKGGAYGGGGGSSNNGNCASSGGGGAVRIIWGAGRSFPSNAT